MRCSILSKLTQARLRELQILSHHVALRLPEDSGAGSLVFEVGDVIEDAGSQKAATIKDLGGCQQVLSLRETRAEACRLLHRSFQFALLDLF